MKTQCVNCHNEATYMCCWKNTENGKPPYRYIPFCDKCAMELYKKEEPKLNFGLGCWINLTMEEYEARPKEVVF